MIKKTLLALVGLILVLGVVGAIRIPTISHERVEDTDTAAFLTLHQYFQDSYPLVHEHLTRETVADLSLLYTWQGSDRSLEPMVLMGHQDVVPVIPGTEGDWTHPASRARWRSWAWPRRGTSTSN